MKSIILAAGFAKRLQPHIGNLPKPMLTIAGIPLIDIIMHKICEVNEVQEVFIVTNELYYDTFSKWKDGRSYSKSVSLVSDGIKTIDKKMGAIGDLSYVVRRFSINDNLLVIAGDNYFEFSLQDFVNRYKSLKKTMIAVCDLKEAKKLSKKFGVVRTDSCSRIIEFEEKPEKPSTSLASTLCYLLGKDEINALNRFISKNPEADNTGNFIHYLIENGHELYAYVFSERWYDIGDYQQYLELNELLWEKHDI